MNTGLTVGDVITIATSGNNIFAGTGGGVFLSTNNGNSWKAVNNGLSFKPAAHPYRLYTIYSLAISGSNIFAATGNGGVFLSTDNGNSWTAVNNGLSGDGLSVITIAINGRNIFAGTGVGGVFLSTNNGGSWTAMNNGLSVDGLTVDALTISGNNIFAGTSGGVFLSTNNGNTWTAVNSGLFGTSLNVRAITINGSNIFAGTYLGGVIFSTNYGSSWTEVNNGLGALHVWTLTISGTDIYAGTENGIWKRPLDDIKILNVSANEINIASSDNSIATFNINSNTYWKVSSSETWLTVSYESGSGNAAITLTAMENTTDSPRTAIITISGGFDANKTITVTLYGNGTEDNKINIYPNPANNVLFIYGITQNTKVSIFDLNGKLILSNYLTEAQINISNLSGGIYIIRFENSTGIVTRKFVKQRDPY